MKQLILVGVVIFGMVSMAFGASNLYKMRNGAVVTSKGQELIDLSNRMCQAFGQLQQQFQSMTEQRDNTTDFTTPSIQWGTIDSLTNAPSEPVMEAMYAELNSMLAAAGPSLLQWCGRVAQ